MDTTAILEIIKLSVQQNYALNTGSLLGLFLFLLITGYLPNMFLNMLFVVVLLCDTMSANAIVVGADHLLKSWTILGSVIVFDYVFHHLGMKTLNTSIEIFHDGRCGRSCK